MPNPFSRTSRSLQADGVRRWIVALLIGFALLAAWVGWLLAGEVPVYEVTRLARLEVDEEVIAIQAEVGGKVLSHRLVVGRDVAAGEVLAEVDAQAEKLQLSEEEARLRAIKPQIKALRAELRAERRAQKTLRKEWGATIAEAKARRKESEAAARYAGIQAKRFSVLRKGGHVSKAEVDRTRAEEQQRRAAAEAMRIAVGRQRLNLETQVRDRNTRVARLRRDLSLLTGEAEVRAATIKRLRYEINRRKILSPASGRLGEVATVHYGSIIRAGDRLGTIVPNREIKIVADYMPSQAIGRIREGQEGQLRVDAFPWTQYGSIHAKVIKVATQARYGRIRVELSVIRRAGLRIPLKHGLPGTLEIEVEKVSPAALVLRAAGALVDVTGTQAQ